MAKLKVEGNGTEMKRAISREANARIVSWGDKFSARRLMNNNGRQGRRRRGGTGRKGEESRDVRRRRVQEVDSKVVEVAVEGKG